MVSRRRSRGCRRRVKWCAGVPWWILWAALSKQRLSSSALFTGAEARSPRRVFRVAAPSWASRRFALSQRFCLWSAEVKLRGTAPAASQRCCESSGGLERRNTKWSFLSKVELVQQPPFWPCLNAANAYRRGDSVLETASAHSYRLARRDPALRRGFKGSQVRLNLSPFQPPHAAEAHLDKPSSPQRLQAAIDPAHSRKTART